MIYTPKILMIEDDDGDAYLTCELLKEAYGAGYQCEWVKDTNAILESAAEHDFDLCLLDYSLPGKNGLEVAADIKKSHYNFPIIMLTGVEAIEIDAKASQIGIYDYLVKGEITARTLERSIRYAIERRKMEHNLQVLKERQKMEALGHLAGGMAHELNNLIQPVLLLSEMLREDTDISPEHARSLSSIVESSRMAGSIINDVLVFARNDQIDNEAIDLFEVLEKSAGFVNEIFPSTIEIELKGISALKGCTAMINERECKQVFMNLLSNAKDAMPDGGKITIDFSMHGFSDNVRQLGLTSNDYALVVISDTGKGISPDNINSIFNPFFTTKDVGEGTGLGLSIAYNIIRSWNGTITVDSAINKGSSFSLYIPLAKDEVSEQTA